MKSAAVLLGAGASMDAGLPSTFGLTRQVYHDLAIRDAESARVFGYVVAKLLTRSVRQGGSPFSDVNVEEVYATLKRFLAKSIEPISEFVTSWDDLEEISDSRPRQFSQSLQSLFHLTQGLNGPVIRADRKAIKKVQETLFGNAGGALTDIEVERRLHVYIEALVRMLQDDDGDTRYIDELVQFCASSNLPICTLNYDLLVEKSCRDLGFTYDYGLSRWNESKFVRFHGQSLKLIKLHGSINWYENSDNITIDDEYIDHRTLGWAARGVRGMIFGGQGEKLVPNGPYLQLRHEFQTILRKCSVLAIVGYSLSDIHLNTIIRSWVSSRKNAKLIFVDPSQIQLTPEKIGKWYHFDSQTSRAKFNTDVVHILSGAKKGMSLLLEELSSPPEDQERDLSEGSVRTVVP